MLSFDPERLPAHLRLELLRLRHRVASFLLYGPGDLRLAEAEARALASDIKRLYDALLISNYH
ncbi:hypothetical protein SVA_3133 [Sulfurifustis variabilis]|uniref:Uncharacterized protein n=1 Tax=Sulfurifustis variabilis TaxID=1675686 RepID=A0A1B4VCS5_9GAMM|nr:hypothetical protein SVA_3133 [Sulfurifustis variabilis]